MVLALHNYPASRRPLQGHERHSPTLETSPGDLVVEGEGTTMSGERPAYTAYTADEALARLKEGNARFVAGHARFPTVQKEVLADLAKGQHPFATILGCSDSRVPPELVFDASFGELFVIRVAGNVLGPAIAGTLQYAGVHLHTPLLVVLGHEGCGAVEAAIAEKFHGVRHRSRIAWLLADIIPALETLDPTLPPTELLNAGIDANVRWTLRKITASPEWREWAESGNTKAVGAVYDLDTGHVRFLE
jgi:carbonic anhydrase